MLLLLNASALPYFILQPLPCCRLHGGPWQLLLVDQSRIARLAPPAVLIRIVVGVAPRTIRIRGPFGTPIRGFVFPLVFFQAKAPPLAFPFFLCPPGKCPPPGPPLGGKAARAKQPSGASAAPGACAWPLCTAGASFGFWPGGGGGRRPRKIQPLMPSVLWARPLYGLHVLIHTVHAMHCHVLPQG